MKKAKKINSAMQIIAMINPFYTLKNAPYNPNGGHDYRYHFNAYQRNHILPILIQPIQSALNAGNRRIAMDRFNRLFKDLGLKYDYDALMLRAYLVI